jgi:two-component system, sensor histidine kinase and response regulator
MGWFNTNRRGVQMTTAVKLQDASEGLDQQWLILIVTSDDDRQAFFQDTLACEAYNLTSVKHIESTFNHCKQAGLPDVLLLDTITSTTDSFELCRKLKSLPGGEDLSIIVLVAGDERLIQQALDAGATDYISPPVTPATLRQRVDQQLTIHGLRQAVRQSERRYYELREMAADYSREMHRQKEQLKQQALKLQARNEELDAFAYTVAHDLKNPIASIIGFTSLINKYYDRMTDEQAREHIGLIMEGAYKLKDIINSLLVLAGVNRLEKAELTPLNMSDIVEEAKKRLTLMLEETGARITAPSEWPHAAGYGPWVEEVWANYISNALKYGGRPPQIELGADTLVNGMVRFWVRDNGKGLTPEEQERVFTPFTRLNQVKIEGHGLGLSVVQRIVQKLGGEVGVESKIGKGSVFSFTLPRESSSELQPQ